MTTIRATPHDLAKFAANILQHNDGDAEKALPKFDAALRKNDGLRHAVLFDYLSRVQPQKQGRKPRNKSVHVDEHQRNKPRSKAEREAEMRSAEHHVEVLRSVFEHQVNNRPIGQFRWGELTLAVRENAYNAASYLRLGTEATANALLLDKVHGHARVDDHETLVSAVLSAKQLQSYLEEAQREAPLRIEEGMHRYAASLEASQPKELLQ
jgi:hypothetical protein